MGMSGLSPIFRKNLPPYITKMKRIRPDSQIFHIKVKFDRSQDAVNIAHVFL